MEEIIEAERDSGIEDHPKPAQKRKRKSRKKEKCTVSDRDDNDFTGSSSDDNTSSCEESDCVEITNEVVCYYLNIYCGICGPYKSCTARRQSPIQNNSFLHSTPETNIKK